MLASAVAVAAGAIALGGAIDLALKASAKTKLAAILSRMTSASGTVPFRGSQVARSFFGPRLFSKKSIARSIALSLTSLVIAYGFAYVSSPPQVREQIAIFHGEVDAGDWILLILALFASLVADVLSFAQTRVFLTAVDRFKSLTVTIGLLLADGLISIGLFVLTFSVFRFLAYTMIISGSGDDAHQKWTVVPAAIPRNVVVDAPDDASRLLHEVAGRADPNISAALLKKAVASRLPSDLRDKVRTTVESKCATTEMALDAYMDTDALEKLVQQSVSAQYGQTPEAERVSGTAISIYRKRVESVYSLNLDKGCPFKALVIDQSVPETSVLRAAGLANTFLASMERTIFDAYQLTGYKMAPYVGFDPFASMKDFSQSLQLVSQQSFLGLTPPDAWRSDFLGHFKLGGYKDGSYLIIPFSPMLFSSLTITLLFCVYCLFLAASRGRNALGSVAARLIPHLAIDKAPVTVGMLSLGLALLTLAIFVDSASYLWLLLFR